MKKYVITLSKVFPTTHKRAGEITGFRINFRKTKLHTIRANYPLWEARFKEIAEGKACLCVRQWTGKPYCSKQEEIACLTREDGIGLQCLESWEGRNPKIDGKYVFRERVAWKDGLSVEDWLEWFRKYDKTKPMAIIQFTDFRYK